MSRCGVAVNTTGAAVNAGPASFVGLISVANFLTGNFTRFNDFFARYGF